MVFRRRAVFLLIGDRGTGKWGVIDAAGELVVPIIFDELRAYGGGLVAAVYSDGGTSRWGLFNLLP